MASALASRWPELVWECSHIGGDRFAGNLVVLPHGFYYGRLDPAAAVALADTTADGRLDLSHLRGRSTLPMPMQAAEVYLRRTLGADRIRTVTPRGRTVDGDLTVATFDVAGETYAVTVRTTYADEPALLTCQSSRADRIPRHELVELHKAASST